MAKQTKISFLGMKMDRHLLAVLAIVLGTLTIVDMDYLRGVAAALLIIYGIREFAKS